jgi:ABC-2 type transport system permease protein
VPTIFLSTLLRFRGQILGWGFIMCLMGVVTVVRYNIVQSNQQAILQLLQGSLGSFVQMFGDVTKLTTPAGFLTLAFFSYMPLVLGAFAVLAGSGLIVADEEQGTLDLVLAHPVTRTAFYIGRQAGFTVATFAILALSWLGFLAARGWSSLDIGVWSMARPYLSLAGVLFFYAELALLLSLLLPARRTAAMASGIVLLASYFVTTLARLDKGLEPVARFSPIWYYQSGEAIDGLKGSWLAGLFGAAGLFALLAWWCFERRDIRVVGESGWRWPLWRSKASR